MLVSINLSLSCMQYKIISYITVLHMHITRCIRLKASVYKALGCYIYLNIYMSSILFANQIIKLLVQIVGKQWGAYTPA